MSKHKKKRNKQYTGADAAASTKGPVVHRYVAVQRSPLGEWWHDHKRAAKITGIVAGGGTLAIWFIYEGLRLIF